MCYCSKSAGEGQGLAEKKRKENQRGLGTLPYGNFIIRTVGKYGEFCLCVRTQAVLAIFEICYEKNKKHIDKSRYDTYNNT